MNNGKHRLHSKPHLDELIGKRVRVDLGYDRWVEGVLADTDIFTNLTMTNCRSSHPLGSLSTTERTVEFSTCVVRGAAIKAIILADGKH